MRVRVRFTKTGKVRFVSHRDLARIWERALRRAELPVMYSGGFSPRPRLHFGLALSVGHESFAEFLDVDVVESLSPQRLAELPGRFSEMLPEGVDCSAVAAVDTEDQRSLQEAVSSVTWTLQITGERVGQVQHDVAHLLAAPSVMVQRDRKGKTHHDDIRPYVRQLRVLDPTKLDQAGTESAAHIALTALAAGAGADRAVAVLHAELATQPRGLRPSELIAALGSGWQERRVLRLAQWIDQPDGSRVEPLALAAPVAHERVGAR